MMFSLCFIVGLVPSHQNDFVPDSVTAALCQGQVEEPAGLPTHLLLMRQRYSEKIEFPAEKEVQEMIGS
jgi:hypothetical protein